MSAPKTTVQELALKWQAEYNLRSWEGDTRWWLRAIADVLEKKAIEARVGEVVDLLREEAREMSQPELLPCPFCGGTDAVGIAGSGEFRAVMCHSCGAQGPDEKWSDAEAIAAWNRRALPQQEAGK